MSSPRCPFVTILSPQQSPLTSTVEGGRMGQSLIITCYRTLGSQSIQESCSEQATASSVPLLRHNKSVSAETPKSGRFQEFPAAAGLGKKTPGMILTLGRAGRTKGSCSGELNAVIPQWLLLQREQHLDLSFQVFWAGGKRLQCASDIRDKKRQAIPTASPFPQSSA